MRGITAALAATVGVCGAAHAGAWPLKPGQTQAITTFSFTRSNERFEGPAIVAIDAEFRKVEGRVFLERGLLKRLTLVAQGAYARSELRSTDAASTGGAGEFEAGLRWTAWRGRRTVGAFQGVVGGVTGFSGARDPVTGANGVDLEGRALVGLTLDDLIAGGFIDIQAAYRRRFGDAADEVRFDLTAGGDAGFGDVRYFLQSFNSFGVTDAQGGFERARIHKIASSAVFPLSRKAFDDAVQIQIGVERSVAGRSAFKETRVFTSLWLTF